MLSSGTALVIYSVVCGVVEIAICQCYVLVTLLFFMHILITRLGHPLHFPVIVCLHYIS